MPIAPINDPDARDRYVPAMDFGAEPPDDSVQVDADTPVEELEDGSAVVQLEEAPAAAEADFFANLAETLDSNVLSALARQLIEDVDYDRECRKPRDAQYAEGIKRTGLGDQAPGGAEFDGASRAVHPALLQGCIDFSARAIKELFPASGPCKTHIIGPATAAKVQKAERKRQYMNWQLTTQIKNYRNELEILLTQLPLGGSQYMKFWHDARYQRPAVETVFVDKLHLPFASSSLYTAARVTHEQDITQAQFEARVASGLYADVDSGLGGASQPDTTESQEAAAKVEGKEDLAYNEDGLRRVLESHVDLVIPEDPLGGEDETRPYVLTVCETSGKVLGLYRNWAEGDKRAEKLQWFVDYTMIPWRGAQGIGLAHIIGGLSGAATGALRALLDSAHIANVPGAIKLKGNRTSGQSVTVAPTEIAEIEGPTGVDDIRKLAMPLPFNPPSQVLFSLLEWLTQEAQGVLAVAAEKIADGGANMPVGTALALIEQGSVTFSAVHARLHAAQAQGLAILHRLNAQFMDDSEAAAEVGDLGVTRADFEGPLDVVPVSDPNIFSDAQRYAQLQAVLQLAGQAPGLYNMGKLHQRALQLLKVPEAADLLMLPGDPEERDAVAENVEANKVEVALKAYQDQDHLEHLRLHLRFMINPVLCANPLMGSVAVPKLLEHCKEHLLMYYAQHVLAATQAQMAVQQSMGAAPGMEPPQQAGAAMADQELAKQLADVMPLLQQAMQLAKQLGPQPQVDPSVQVAQIHAQATTANAQMSMQVKQAQQAMDDKFRNIELQLEDTISKAELQAQTALKAQELQLAQSNAALAAQTEESRRKSAEYLAVIREIAANDQQEKEADFKRELTRMAEEHEKQMLLLSAAPQERVMQMITDYQAAQNERMQRMQETLQKPARTLPEPPEPAAARIPASVQPMHAQQIDMTHTAVVSLMDMMGQLGQAVQAQPNSMQEVAQAMAQMVAQMGQELQKASARRGPLKMVYDENGDLTGIVPQEE